MSVVVNLGVVKTYPKETPFCIPSIWDKNHYNIYNSRPNHENRDRMISLAVGERESLHLSVPFEAGQPN